MVCLLRDESSLNDEYFCKGDNTEEVKEEQDCTEGVKGMLGLLLLQQ